MILSPTDLKSHPFFARWTSIHDRCYNNNVRDYLTVGARGIKVVHEWNRRNPDGFKNFVRWIEDELRKRPHLKSIRFKLTRRDIEGDYGPRNCHLTTVKVANQNRTTAVLTAETVISLRQFIKANPEMTLTQVAMRFDISLANLSRAARGVTWSNLNAVEPPIEARVGVVEPI